MSENKVLHFSDYANMKSEDVEKKEEFVKDSLNKQFGIDTLTKEQFESVKNVLADSTTKDNEFLQSLPSNNGVETTPAVAVTEEVTYGTVDAHANPVTGDIVIDGRSDEEKALDESLANQLNVTIEELYKNPDSFDDALAPFLKDALDEKGVTGVDVLELLSLVKEYQKKASDETIYWYDKLPVALRHYIDTTYTLDFKTSKRDKNFIAETLLQDLYVSAGMDKIHIDVDAAMKDAFDMSPIAEMLADASVTTFEVKYEENRKKAEEAGDVEKAKWYADMQDAFHQSYTYERFIEAAKSRKIRIKRIDVEKINRLIYNFNHKYEVGTDYAIYDISMIIPVLKRKIVSEETGITVTDILKFVASICKYTENMSSTDIIDHTYMYYTVKHILNWDMVKKDSEITFAKNLEENIVKAVLAVKEANPFQI